MCELLHTSLVVYPIVSAAGAAIGVPRPAAKDR